MYCLADGTYPKYKIFVTTLSAPSTRQERAFCSQQEAVRKGVERVFGVLFKQFGILAIPSSLFFCEDMQLIMQTCCILHNMIVEKRSKDYTGDGAGGTRSEHMQYSTSDRECSMSFSRLHSPESSFLATRVEQIALSDDICNEERHKELVAALIDHICVLRGRQSETIG